jgi:GDP-mannose 6-dehydrogenase
MNYDTDAANMALPLDTDFAPTLSVIGCGLVGLADAIGFSQQTGAVTMVDCNPERLRRLRAGNSGIDEPGLDAALAEAFEAKQLRLTTSVSGALAASQVCFLASPVAITNEGQFDTHDFMASAQQVGLALAELQDYRLLVVRSLLAPGCIEDEVIPALERYSGKRCGVDFGLSYCPEVLRPGVALADYRNPVRLLIGAADAASRDLTRWLFRKRLGTVCELGLREVSVTRCLDLAWQAIKIQFAEEMASYCRETGSSLGAVSGAFKADTKQNISSCYLVPDCPQPEKAVVSAQALLRLGAGAKRRSARKLQLAS